MKKTNDKKEKKSAIQNLLTKLNISEKYTKPTKIVKVYTKVKDTLPSEANYNMMADLLMLPETKKGFRYCLVMVDLMTDAFDIEAIKTKEPQAVLDGMKRMFKRKYIKEAYASIRTDSGSEFLGVFHKYLYDHSILHRIAGVNRHYQMSSVESLNRTLGRLLNGFMNTKEFETKKPYLEWTEAIDTIREDLNIIRTKKLADDMFTQNISAPNLIEKEQEFNVGDIVYRQSDVPLNALGQKLSGQTFREGDFHWDLTPRKVLQVFYYSGKITYRYHISGIENIAYPEHELMLAPKTETVEKYIINKIIDKRKVSNKIQYLCWWKKYLKTDSTWENKKELLEDGASEYIDEYEESLKKKK